MILTKKNKARKLTKAALVLVSMLLVSTSSFSQTSINWEKSYGGTNSDIPSSIELTHDGGYIVVGSSESSDGNKTAPSSTIDYWIVKLGKTGAVEWEKTYGGTGVDIAQSVVETNDNGFLVLGTSNSHDGDISGNHSLAVMEMTDFWAIKLDSVGNIVWKKCLGGSFYDNAHQVIKDKNGDFVIVGTTHSSDFDVQGFKGATDVWVVKIDASGNILWSKTYGGTSEEEGRYIANTSTGYIIAGTSKVVNGDVTANYGGVDVWVISIDFNGGLLWQKSYGGSDFDEAVSIIQNPDGGFYVACNSNSSDMLVTQAVGKTDYWVLKIDSVGSLLWQKTIGTIEDDVVGSMCLSADGGCMLAGYYSEVVNQLVTDKKYWIVQLDKQGNINWTDSLGGSNYDLAKSIKHLGYNDYIVAGMSKSKDGNVSGHHAPSCGALPDYWLVSIQDTSTYVTVQKVEACYSYTWIDGVTYTTSNNTARDTLVSRSGKDSIVILDLAIIDVFYGVDKVTACGAYTWIDGITYTANNNTATDTLISIHGCDSIVTLNLTIIRPAYGVDKIVACEPYTWINGVTYSTNNNTATDTLVGVNGCDSIVFLDLSMGETLRGVDKVTACKSYTWINGITYTASNNTATDTLKSVNGCDSIVRLDLTINKLDTSLIVSDLMIISNAVDVDYQWLDCDNNFAPISSETGRVLKATANGIYAVEVSDAYCADTSRCVEIKTVGLEEVLNSNRYAIFPNPSTGLVNVELQPNKTYFIKVFNVKGQLVYEELNLSGHIHQFTLDVASGIYVLELASETEIQRTKLIVNKN